MSKKFEIRNSTAEFLIFQIKGKEDGVQVVYQDESIWCTQKAMSQLFDVGILAISKHLKNFYETGELVENSVISKVETTVSDGKNYNTTFNILDAIISVGYRVNSTRTTQFRQWCTFVLRQFAIRGYVIDKKCKGERFVYRRGLFWASVGLDSGDTFEQTPFLSEVDGYILYCD